MDDSRDDLPARGAGPTPEGPQVPADRPQWSADPHGNLKGPIFSFPSDNLVIYTDQAVTDPAELAGLRKAPN
ncbi:MAG: hypothetical protein K2X87_09970 [Gemmataceae bacterium]|nr:hypothetical protein [Gemmataceae bacterium]